MNVTFNIHWAKYKDRHTGFVNSCNAVIRNVGQSTKSATEQACSEIMQESQAQVPIDTGALASSGWYNVQRRGDAKGYRYEGILGYAGFQANGYNGDSHTAGSTVFRNERNTTSVGYKALANAQNRTINPESGKPVYKYAARVHEDLRMPHRNGGKAKFLEDPVRAYASRFKRVAESYWKSSIEMANLRFEVGAGYTRGNATNKTAFINRKVPIITHTLVKTNSPKVQKAYTARKAGATGKAKATTKAGSSKSAGAKKAAATNKATRAKMRTSQYKSAQKMFAQRSAIRQADYKAASKAYKEGKISKAAHEAARKKFVEAEERDLKRLRELRGE